MRIATKKQRSSAKNTASIDLSIDGFAIESVNGETLYASSIDAVNTFDNPDNVAPEEIKALMSTISGGEGGPTSVQGIGAVEGLDNMTIDDAITKAKSFIGKGLLSDTTAFEDQ